MSAAKVIDGSRLVTGAYPVKYAREWVESVHRRIPEMVGAMWCIGLWRGREMRGLAVVGRPSARMLGAPARTRVPLLEVLRVAVVEDTHNGCSTLYGACARAARGMGVDGILTYIHKSSGSGAPASTVPPHAAMSSNSTAALTRATATAASHPPGEPSPSVRIRSALRPRRESASHRECDRQACVHRSLASGRPTA